MSTPRYVSNAGSAIQTRPSGRPEENDCSVTAPIRREVAAAFRLASIPTRVLDAIASSVRSLTAESSL